MKISFSQLGLQGRLGNQLFQVAATESLAFKNGWTAEFPKWDYSRHFNHHFNQADPVQFDSVYTEQGFNFSEIPVSPNMDLRGYFQSEKYFDEKHVRHIFTFKEPAPKHDACVIHLRRGDYLALTDYFAELPKQYYQNAIKELNPSRCIVISDDLQMAQKFFDWDTFEFFDKGEIECLKLMASAKQVIMANSSFGWWGAWLSGGEVAAPAQWFTGRAAHYNTNDLIPERWKKINW